MTEHLEHLRLVGTAEVARLFGLGSRQLYNLVRSGDFPAPVRVGKRRLGWRLIDLERHLEDRTARPAERLTATTPALLRRLSAQAALQIEALIAAGRREASAARRHT